MIVSIPIISAIIMTTIAIAVTITIRFIILITIIIIITVTIATTFIIALLLFLFLLPCLFRLFLLSLFLSLVRSLLLSSPIFHYPFTIGTVLPPSCPKFVWKIWARLPRQRPRARHWSWKASGAACPQACTQLQLRVTVVPRVPDWFKL